MTNAHENAQKICAKFEDGTLTFDDTFTQLEENFGIEPNPFEREKIRRTVEAAPAKHGTVLFIEILQYRKRLNEVEIEVHRSNIEQAKLAVQTVRTSRTLLEGALAFYEYTLIESPELGEALTPVFDRFFDQVKTELMEQKTKHEEEAKKNANRIQADSFEGVSEAMPDTVEELLGEVENK